MKNLKVEKILAEFKKDIYTGRDLAKKLFDVAEENINCLHQKCMGETYLFGWSFKLSPRKTLYIMHSDLGDVVEICKNQETYFYFEYNSRARKFKF